MLTVLYDACVLYPATLRDLLIELASSKQFQAKWTTLIHDEWVRNLLVQRPDLTRANLERTIQNMNRAVPSCLVVDFEDLIPSLTLPDVNDRHVLAAAITGQTEYIVTFNLRDFPRMHLEPHGIEAIHPDQFILSLIHSNKNLVLSAFRNTRLRLKNPARTVEEQLERFAAQGLPESMELLEKDKAEL
jgi:predicted nucleic acid-binding protein